MGSGVVGRVAMALTAAVLIAGCTSSPAPPGRPTSPVLTSATPPPLDLPRIGSYVAIGDSFTAGPGLAELRDGTGFCLRSTHNWPSLLASELSVKHLDDVSCAGAVSADALAAHPIPGGLVPAQIAAVKPNTNLVTVSIGGNDGGLYTSLVSACTQQAGACESFARDTVPPILDATVPRIVEVLNQVRAKAPKARVLLVGYLRILPESGTCGAIQIPAADVPTGASAEAAVDRALARAATAADVGYVSMRAASQGHDACAGAGAWTNGGSVNDDDGVAFHPRLAGMRAVARAVALELTR